MNTSSIIVWYETGSCDEIHMPDPPYDAGAAIQREYIDVSDPDKGIFVERTYIDYSGKSTGDIGPYRVLLDRVMVLSPDELATALSVSVHGMEVLRRGSDARTACGLKLVAPVALGFNSERVAGSFEGGPAATA